MRTGSVKNMIPNIPTSLCCGPVCAGTACRAGCRRGFPSHGPGVTVGPALFFNLCVGLDPFDWLVGIVGAVGSAADSLQEQDPKKSRQDEEFGSVRWASLKRYSPFVIQSFENNKSPHRDASTMNTAPKIRPTPATSTCSGSVRPAPAKLGSLAHTAASPGQREEKGRVQLCGGRSKWAGSSPGGGSQRRGLSIKVFNSIDFSQSMHYNPWRISATS